MPAEMVFTGKQPKDLSDSALNEIEDAESTAFQTSLYSNILQYANYGRYYMYVGVQDVNTTLNTLKENNISIRDSWKMDGKKLAEMLGVDAVVRMQITKKRFMSDYASYGVDIARNVLNETPLRNKLPVPYSIGKTEDIYAYCSVVSDDITLWNNHYKGTANWNNPSNEIIENITASFGRNFPYKHRK
ncbi:MAG: hypothetical protein JSU05_03340 [Bacteroidetes bacterium]|nr:hypothetical protein [Bacteroidota bacterium]